MIEAAAPLPPDAFLRPRDVAARTGYAVATLAAMRCRGDGPPFRKSRGAVFYRWADVCDWLGDARRSTSDHLAPVRVA
jgi:hypothetical protein